MKTCSKCNTSKEFSEFGKRSSNKDGLNYYCKSCCRGISQDYRNSNSDKTNMSATKSRRNLDWNVRLFRGTRSTAHARNLEHTITAEDILEIWQQQNGECYWLGVKLSEDYIASRHPLSPSLDRLDNSKGYIKDNVVITSTFANLGRSNTTVEDFSEFLNLIQQEKIYGNSSPSGK